MNANLYLIGIKCSLKELAAKVSLVEGYNGERHVGYSNFWENIVFIEYNIDTKQYLVKEVIDNEVHYTSFSTEKCLFQYMDDNNIQFVSDESSLGEIFESYSMMYLTLIRWVGDICYTRDLYEKLLEE